MQAAYAPELNPALDLHGALRAPSLPPDLHRDLSAARFTVDTVTGRLTPPVADALSEGDVDPAEWKLEGDGSALATMVRLWLVGAPVPLEQARQAFPATGIERLAAAGLVREHDGLLWAAHHLQPYASDDTGDLWVLSGLASHQRARRGWSAKLPSNYVLGIGGASLTLAQSTPRPVVARALDVGVGCGIQTFHLLRHSRHVVATDLSPWAVDYARFNVLLNAAALGVDPDRPDRRVEFRTGDLLEPVAGETFDLVVSNPPFVIAPPGTPSYSYRTATVPSDTVPPDIPTGLPAQRQGGDFLVERLIRELPAVLAPGGSAHLLANWEHVGLADWRERVRGWLDPHVDSWVLQRDVLDPVAYATMWLRDGGTEPGAGSGSRTGMMRSYLGNFRKRGVDAVGMGVVHLRRPAVERPGRHLLEEHTGPLAQPVGPEVGASFSRWDRLATAPVEELRLRTRPDVTEERHLLPGAEHPTVILLRQGSGLCRARQVSSVAAGFTGACDGELAAGQILEALQSLLAGDDDFLPTYVEEVRSLVEEGFLDILD